MLAGILTVTEPTSVESARTQGNAPLSAGTRKSESDVRRIPP